MKRALSILVLALGAAVWWFWPSRQRESPEREDQPGEALEHYLDQRVPAGTRELPVERYFTAMERMRRMRLYSSRGQRFVDRDAKTGRARNVSLGTWEALGPGNVGGRTRSLVIHPTQPNIMYAAGVAGGVWKTTDSGASWRPLSDLLPNIAVSTLAMDPANPDVIFAGTGEGFNNIDAVRGAGIFRTLDGGETWVRLPATNNLDFYFVNKLVISPFDSRRIYAATRTGVWRSRDGGESWELILERAAPAFGCQDLVIRPDRPGDYLYASCRANPQGAVWRNENASQNDRWEFVFTTENMQRTSLAIAASRPSTIYALAASGEPGTCPANPGPNPAGPCYRDGMLGVYRSTQDGNPGSWEARATNRADDKLNTVLLSNPQPFFSDECFGGRKTFSNQGWYDNVIAVDPVNADIVWAGGIDLFRSDDGGANWGIASYWWARNSPTYSHADHHGIVFHPQYDGEGNQTIFDTNDGGIFRTDNGRAAAATGRRAACSEGNSSIQWTDLNNGYAVTQFYHGSVYPGGHFYFAGAQDNGTTRGADSGGPNRWSRVFSGDGGYTAIDPKDARNVYTATTRLSFVRSSDGGLSFRRATNGITEPATNFFFIAPYRMDPSDSNRLWTGGRGVWRSSDGGQNWTAASGLLSEASITAVAIAPTDPNRVLVGTRAGGIFRNLQSLETNGESQWASSTPRIGSVAWIEFDPVNADVVYAVYSSFNAGAADRHVYRSTDSGATWGPIDGEGDSAIPDVPVHSIAVHPVQRDLLYAGTDMGVFVSVDGGASWAQEDSGFPNTVVETLHLEPAGSGYWLFAFTHGRGAWRVWLGPGAPCEYSFKADRLTVPSAGGTVSINVETAPGCAWSVVSPVNSVEIASPASGTGTGSVTLRVSRSSIPSREIDLQIANQTVRLRQGD